MSTFHCCSSECDPDGTNFMNNSYDAIWDFCPNCFCRPGFVWDGVPGEGRLYHAPKEIKERLHKLLNLEYALYGCSRRLLRLDLTDSINLTLLQDKVRALAQEAISWDPQILDDRTYRHIGCFVKKRTSWLSPADPISSIESLFEYHEHLIEVVKKLVNQINEFADLKRTAPLTEADEQARFQAEAAEAKAQRALLAAARQANLGPFGQRFRQYFG